MLVGYLVSASVSLLSSYILTPPVLSLNAFPALKFQVPSQAFTHYIFRNGVTQEAGRHLSGSR